MSYDPLVESLRSIFAPIIRQSAKWPPILAYGLPSMVAVLLIIALGLAVRPSLIWLLAIVILAPLVAYIIADSSARPGCAVGAILSPQSNGLVQSTIYCSGVASGIRRGQHVWLAVEAQGFIWPKDREVYIAKDCTWNHTIFEDGAVDAFSLALLVADRNGSHEIENWLEMGKRKGEYALMKEIPGTSRLARIDNVRRISHLVPIHFQASS